jgi:hypothetical protein
MPDLTGQTLLNRYRPGMEAGNSDMQFVVSMTDSLTRRISAYQRGSASKDPYGQRKYCRVIL